MPALTWPASLDDSVNSLLRSIEADSFTRCRLLGLTSATCHLAGLIAWMEANKAQLDPEDCASERSRIAGIAAKIQSDRQSTESALRRSLMIRNLGHAYITIRIRKLLDSIRECVEDGAARQR